MGNACYNKTKLYSFFGGFVLSQTGNEKINDGIILLFLVSLSSVLKSSVYLYLIA